MGRLAIRGVNYDTGTAFVGGVSSRAVWALDDVRRDMAVIAGDLGCTDVCLYGTDSGRLLEAAEIALEAGLAVMVQRRVIDEGPEAMRQAVVDCARRVTALGAADRLTLNLGCEASLFTTGFLPGRSFLTRMKLLGPLWPIFVPLIAVRLSRLLRTLAADVRAVFPGPLIYSSGTWELIDWTPLDFVGVDLYRDRENERSYRSDLRRYLAHGKPLVITEFGCCSYEGAERLGGGGWLAIDHSKDPPEVRPGHVRSEAVQAAHLAELIEIFEAEGVHGAFAFTFMEPGNRHAEDPLHDLDMASYGLVKVLSGEDAARIEWARKQAFDAVARSFSRTVES